MEQPVLVNVIDPVNRSVFPAELRHSEKGYYLERSNAGQQQTDLYLSPGWIDLHVHIYDGVTPIGIPADAIGLKTGVHLLADAGSAGEATINGLINYVAPSFQTPVQAWLNISSIGLVHMQEASEISWLHVGKTMEAAQRNRPFICGIKVRCAKGIVGSLDLQPLKLALHAARSVDLPLMVHIGEAPPIIDDVLDLLDAGDVVTHCFHGKACTPWQSDGDPIPALQRALERGVLLDVGHGGGSFRFEVAKKAMAAGHFPFSISTDAHALNVNGPVYDLPTTMTKMMACGMSLVDAIAAVTHSPAKVLKRNDWCRLNGILQQATLFRLSRQPAINRTYLDTMKQEIVPEQYIVPVAVITEAGGLKWLP